MEEITLTENEAKALGELQSVSAQATLRAGELVVAAIEAATQVAASRQRLQQVVADKVAMAGLKAEEVRLDLENSRLIATSTE